MLNKTLITILSVFILLIVPAFADDHGGGEDPLGPFPELFVAVVGIVGIVILHRGVKNFGGALQKVFNMSKLGLVLLILAFGWLALAEVQETEDEAYVEIGFELLSVLSILSIALGPVLYFPKVMETVTFSNTSSKKRSKK